MSQESLERCPPAQDDSEEDAELFRAGENFLGAKGGNPDQVEFYRHRALGDLIADPDVPEARKAKLRIERAKLNPKPLKESEVA